MDEGPETTNDVSAIELAIEDERDVNVDSDVWCILCNVRPAGDMSRFHCPSTEYGKCNVPQSTETRRWR